MRVKKRIQSRWSTATCAAGFGSAISGGGRTIICRWWRESVGTSGISLKSGMRKRWRAGSAADSAEGTAEARVEGRIREGAKAGAGAGGGTDRKEAQA